MNTETLIAAVSAALASPLLLEVTKRWWAGRQSQSDGLRGDAERLRSFLQRGLDGAEGELRELRSALMAAERERAEMLAELATEKERARWLDERLKEAEARIVHLEQRLANLEKSGE